MAALVEVAFSLLPFSEAYDWMRKNIEFSAFFSTLQELPPASSHSHAFLDPRRSARGPLRVPPPRGDSRQR